MKKILQGIDLHLHTTSSDGSRTVDEMLQDAYEYGLRHIALTDHNQFAVLHPMDYHGMEIVPGAEFSASYTTRAGRKLEIHVVGLFFEGVPEEIRQIFEYIPIQRKCYVDAILSKLNELGIAFSYEELRGEFPDSNQIGRRHIAEALVKKGHAVSITDAFDRLIGNRSPHWVDSAKYMEYISLETCVQKICENHGFAILAHPYHYHCTDEEIVELVKTFQKAAKGAPAGLEVYYFKYDKEKRETLLRVAKEFGLYPSASSDRHAAEDPFVRGEEALLQAMKEAFRLRK